MYLPVQEISSLLPKATRIESLIPFVSNGYVRFSKKHKKLLQQMYQYPVGKNDDAPDCLDMVVKLAINSKVGKKIEYTSVLSRGFKAGRGCW